MWSWISGGRAESERWWGGIVMGEEGMAGCGYVESMFLKLGGSVAPVIKVIYGFCSVE